MQLPARALVGRAATCFWRIDQPMASSEHAVVQWNDTMWTVRDLGSRNGTYVDGRRLELSELVTLTSGRRVAFGNPSDAWMVEDTAAPQPMALCLETREVRTGDDELLVLSERDESECAVFRDGEGGWLMEQRSGLSPARDQQVVVVDDRAWCLMLPATDADATPFLDSPLDLASVEFEFVVSPNEEHVELTLKHRNESTSLQSREHFYVLLTLARIRAEHTDRAVGERGWVDRGEILKMLNMTANAFNVAVHRARRQLVAAGVVDASRIVEVRRGERRFGSDRVKILSTER